HFRAVEDDRPLPRSQGACHDLEQGRLASAVGTDQGHRLALLHVQRDAEQRLEVAIPGLDATDAQERQLRSVPRYARLTARLSWRRLGAPSNRMPPSARHTTRRTTRVSTRRTCSTQMIVTPEAWRSATVAMSASVSGSVRPP